MRSFTVSVDACSAITALIAYNASEPRNLAMATLTIRDLDEAVKRNLRIRAASRNRSMEEEARQILRAALLEPPPATEDLASRIRSRFVGLGDVSLSVPAREPVRTPPGFGVASKDTRTTTTPRRRPRNRPGK